MSAQVSFLLKLIATVAMLAASSVVSAGSGDASADHKPVTAAKDAKTLVSISNMSAADHAACVSELTDRKVVFEQLGNVTEQGCQLSGLCFDLGLHGGTPNYRICE